MEKIIQELEMNGYDYAIAIATKAEIEAGAACGQLSIIIEEQNLKIIKKETKKLFPFYVCFYITFIKEMIKYD